MGDCNGDRRFFASLRVTTKEKAMGATTEGCTED